MPARYLWSCPVGKDDPLSTRVPRQRGVTQDRPYISFPQSWPSPAPADPHLITCFWGPCILLLGTSPTLRPLWWAAAAPRDEVDGILRGQGDLRCRNSQAAPSFLGSWCPLLVSFRHSQN